MNGGSIRHNGNMPGASPIPGISPHTTVNGGGVSFTGVFVMNGGVIEDNSAHNGGGIHLQAQGHAAAHARFTMNGGSINDNRAHNGGGINMLGAYFSFNAGSVADNTAFIPATGGNLTHGHGGGIRLAVQNFTGDPQPSPLFPTLTFADLPAAHTNYPGTINITGNEAERHGGGVHFGVGTWNTNQNTGIVNIADNDAAFDGGGIFQSAGTLSIDDNWIFDNNTADRNGGGLFVTGTSAVTMTGGEVTDNSAKTGDGGGIWLAETATLDVADSNFAGNTAGDLLAETGMGGAIFTDDYYYKDPLPLLGEYGNLTLSGGVTFSNNVAHAGAYDPPINAHQLIPNTAFVSPVSTPYTHHPLNNNDINFGYSPFIAIPTMAYGGSVPFAFAGFALFLLIVWAMMAKVRRIIHFHWL